MTDSMQLRDVNGNKINPAVKERQYDQSEHWQETIAVSGVLKAEESGKLIILTDITLSGGSSGYANLREKQAAGTLIAQLRVNITYSTTMSYRQGLKAAAYDGANGGDLYAEISGANVYVFAAGYMRAV